MTTLTAYAGTLGAMALISVAEGARRRATIRTIPPKEVWRVRTITLAGVALVTVVTVVAIVFAVWASVWQAPWEGSGTASQSPATTVSTPSSKLIKAEVIGLVAPRISIGTCEAGELTWNAFYVGDGVWRVAVACGSIFGLRGDPSNFPFPLWSFRESSEQFIPLNDEARKRYIGPVR